MKAASQPIAALPAVTIDEAMTDQQLLGAGLGDPSTWRLWRIILKASFGLPLAPEEMQLFIAVAGNRTSPTAWVRELWVIMGRRGGKSSMAAAIGVFIATMVDHSGKLRSGEIGYVLILAASKLQARLIHGYALGFLRASPVLAQTIAEVTADEIRLKSGIIIATHSNSFRTVRGRTLLAAILDEVSFWRDESTASPDIETYRALLPGLATTNGVLIGISSPYRKTGLIYTKHQAHFGQNNPSVLVIQADTRSGNPTISPAFIEAALEADPEGSQSEWQGEFRNDLSTFVSEHAIEACVEAGIFERPFETRWDYVGFVDCAGGGGPDSMCMAIAHTENKTRILDCVREARPPFSPEAIAEEFAGVFRSYRITKIHGDRYAGNWPSEQFKKHSINFEPSEKPKSELYLHLLPLINSGAVSLLDNRRAIVQLSRLERRTGTGRKDSVDHPRGAGSHDDLANVIAGSLCHAPAEENRPIHFNTKPAIPLKEWDPLAAFR